MQGNERHPLNVPGDFYVQDGCCVSCLVPFEAAGDMLRFDDEVRHCYVCRQPASSGEERSMAEAIGLSEVRCIRYGGTDASILRLLSQAGEQDQCDAISNIASSLHNAQDPRLKSEGAPGKRVWWLRWRK